MTNTKYTSENSLEHHSTFSRDYCNLWRCLLHKIWYLASVHLDGSVHLQRNQPIERPSTGIWYFMRILMIFTKSVNSEEILMSLSQAKDGLQSTQWNPWHELSIQKYSHLHTSVSEEGEKRSHDLFLEWIPFQSYGPMLASIHFEAVRSHRAQKNMFSVSQTKKKITSINNYYSTTRLRIAFFCGDRWWFIL